ncbi:hypothetical protein KSP35_00190 [Aquihabitans sp. G128]|uniref:hypothetical protein n=1 Tax=Aquihabitans sp. G128 TaxID=2849779 RepID=UPI001C2347EE|nr:hypothetical protein [Aquihabitans sp. G128]QXC61312.1 hypothetical protein KSP35_00190 [Aquihabitans sp. G128]
MLLPLALIGAAGTLAMRSPSSLTGTLAVLFLVLAALLSAIGRLTGDPLVVRRRP